MVEKIITQLAFAGVTGIASYYWARYKSKCEVEKAIIGAVCALLRNTIRHGCKNAVKSGWIAQDEKGDLLNCYDLYEILTSQNGIKNGVIDDCVHQMRQLPNIPPKE